MGSLSLVHLKPSIDFLTCCYSSLTRFYNDLAAAESVLLFAKLWRFDVMKQNMSLIKMLNSS